MLLEKSAIKFYWDCVDYTALTCQVSKCWNEYAMSADRRLQPEENSEQTRLSSKREDGRDNEDGLQMPFEINPLALQSVEKGPSQQTSDEQRECHGLQRNPTASGLGMSITEVHGLPLDSHSEAHMLSERSEHHLSQLNDKPFHSSSQESDRLQEISCLEDSVMTGADVFLASQRIADSGEAADQFDLRNSEEGLNLFAAVRDENAKYPNAVRSSQADHGHLLPLIKEVELAILSSPSEISEVDKGDQQYIKDLVNGIFQSIANKSSQPSRLETEEAGMLTSNEEDRTRADPLNDMSNKGSTMQQITQATGVEFRDMETMSTNNQSDALRRHLQKSTDVVTANKLGHNNFLSCDERLGDSKENIDIQLCPKDLLEPEHEAAQQSDSQQFQFKDDHKDNYSDAGHVHKKIMEADNDCVGRMVQAIFEKVLEEAVLKKTEQEPSANAAVSESTPAFDSAPHDLDRSVEMDRRYNIGISLPSYIRKAKVTDTAKSQSNVTQEIEANAESLPGLCTLQLTVNREDVVQLTICSDNLVVRSPDQALSENLLPLPNEGIRDEGELPPSHGSDSSVEINTSLDQGHRLQATASMNSYHECMQNEVSGDVEDLLSQEPGSKTSQGRSLIEAESFSQYYDCSEPAILEPVLESQDSEEGSPMLRPLSKKKLSADFTASDNMRCKQSDSVTAEVQELSVTLSLAEAAETSSHASSLEGPVSVKERVQRLEQWSECLGSASPSPVRASEASIWTQGSPGIYQSRSLLVTSHDFCPERRNHVSNNSILFS